MPTLTYPILTDRLILRPFEDGDLEAVYDMQRREDVTRFLYWGPRTRADVGEMIAKRKGQIQLVDEGDRLSLAVALRGTAELVGDVVLGWHSNEHRQGEIGFVFHPDHQGHGYGQEASEVLLRLGFERFGLHRIIGRCDGRNDASARLMERLGMRREAHFRENEFVKGEWSDELVFAILRTEWAASHDVDLAVDTIN